MFRDTTATEPSKTPAPTATAKPVTEDELNAILDRLAAVQHIFRENRELREVLFHREGEAQKLRSRNAELEEIMRKFTPILLSTATAMGLAAKNENLDRLRRA
jgi:predicted nuclease with TOPRIM domain